MRIKQTRACLMLAVLAAGTASSAAAFPQMPHTDVIIDIGHGGVDGGTTYGSILEKDINLAVGLKLYPLLRKNGISAGMTRITDYALSDDNKTRDTRHRRDLAQRVEIINRLKPRMLISLHVNWADNRAKTGPLVIYRKSHEPSKRLAIRLQAAINDLYSIKTQPEPGKKYYLLRHTHTPGVIVEMGYMSNSQDRSLLTNPDFQKRLAETIAKASVQWLNENNPGRITSVQ